MQKKGLLSSAGIYFISSIINAAIPFLLMPIITKYLSPSDYGIFTMFTILIGLTTPFVGLNIHGAVSRYYFHSDKKSFAIYIYNCFFILLISSITMAIIFFLTANYISTISNFPKTWLWAVVYLAVIQFINQLALVILQVSEQPLKYALFQISNALVYGGLTVFFVVVIKETWDGRIKAQLLTATILAIICLLYLIKSKFIKSKVDRDSIKDALKFGVPLIPHTIGAYIISASDRLFITNMVGLDATGIYSVAFQLGLILSFLTDAFNKAWVPHLFKNLKLENTEVKLKIVKQTYIYYLFLIILAMIIIIAVPIIIQVFIDEKYHSATNYTTWIILGYCLNGMYKMVTNYIFYAHKTIILSYMTFITAILNIFFNYLFIKVNGAIGAAQATALSYFITFIITWILSNRVYPMPWKLK